MHATGTVSIASQGMTGQVEVVRSQAEQDAAADHHRRHRRDRGGLRRHHRLVAVADDRPGARAGSRARTEEVRRRLLCGAARPTRATSRCRRSRRPTSTGGRATSCGWCGAAAARSSSSTTSRPVSRRAGSRLARARWARSHRDDGRRRLQALRRAAPGDDAQVERRWGWSRSVTLTSGRVRHRRARRVRGAGGDQGAGEVTRWRRRCVRGAGARGSRGRRSRRRPAPVDTFDAAWTIVRDTHFDPKMNGVDWDAVRTELRPRALAATNARRAARGHPRHAGPARAVALRAAPVVGRLAARGAGRRRRRSGLRRPAVRAAICWSRRWIRRAAAPPRA